MAVDVLRASQAEFPKFTMDNNSLIIPQIEHDRFLVSFMVDARGGSMRGSRHAGLRVLVPPSAASAPTRITCRLLRPERTAAPPQLNDGEGLASRIIELGPHPCSFNSPVLLEVPHFASVQGRQRELVVLRSDDADTWREHSLEATDQAVKTALGSCFEGLDSAEELREKRIIRILITDFPQYLAIVSRLRQDITIIGPDGGVLTSSLIPQVQAVFPEGSLQKRIRVGLQAQDVDPALIARLLGSEVAVSPIVTIEPRRRKFHKPITLTMPLPFRSVSVARASLQQAGQGVTMATDSNLSQLRLLCSITGGTAPAVWEDITGSTPLSRLENCITFTTTVSARLWLIDFPVVSAIGDVATYLYKAVSAVPYMGKFIVFAKRSELNEALVRCFCLTDDKIDKTLECQEGFEVVTASEEVEVIDDQPAWLEATGNLVPVIKVGEQLRLHFNAFRENRLAFPVRIHHPNLAAEGTLTFNYDSSFNSLQDAPPLLQMVSGAGVDLSPRQLCKLEIVLPLGSETADRIGDLELHAETFDSKTHSVAMTSTLSQSCSQPHQFEHPTQTQPDLDSRGRALTVPPPAWAFVPSGDVIARTQLDLAEVATEVGSDWPALANALFVTDDSTQLAPRADNLLDWLSRRLNSAEALATARLHPDELRTDRDRAFAVLLVWREEMGENATGNELDKVLRHIGREDIVKNCMRDIQPVVESEELEEAVQHISGVFTAALQPTAAQSIEASSPLAGYSSTAIEGAQDSGGSWKDQDEEHFVSAMTGPADVPSQGEEESVDSGANLSTLARSIPETIPPDDSIQPGTAFDPAESHHQSPLDGNGL